MPQLRTPTSQSSTNFEGKIPRIGLAPGRGPGANLRDVRAVKYEENRDYLLIEHYDLRSENILTRHPQRIRV